MKTYNAIVTIKLQVKNKCSESSLISIISHLLEDSGEDDFIVRKNKIDLTISAEYAIVKVWRKK